MGVGSARGVIDYKKCLPQCADSRWKSAQNDNRELYHLFGRPAANACNFREFFWNAAGRLQRDCVKPDGDTDFNCTLKNGMPRP